MLRFFAPLHNSRKLALQLFREEQRNNAGLQGLSAAQKSKVILRKFRQLIASDMEALKRRATIWHAKKMFKVDATEPSGRRNEMTPYELFYKEQLSNPSIASISSPSVREQKLFAIFNSLPDSTKEALEQRARGLSQRGGNTSSSVPLKPATLSKGPASTKTGRKLEGKRGANRKKIVKKNSERKVPRRTTASSYVTFVKEQMPHVMHLPPKERMKAIAEKWNLSKAENAKDGGGADSVVAAAEVPDILLKN